MGWVLLTIGICILVEGFFSGSETGFYSVNRLRLRSRLEADWRGARVLQRLLDRPDETIMTTLIGTNIMVYAASALATELLGTSSHPELYATAIMTPIIFVCGEMIPKDLFRRHADALMYHLAGPVDALRTIVWPAIVVLRWLAALLTGRLPRERRTLLLTRTALTEWIAEGHREGQLSEYQQTLSVNVMGLLRKTVGAAMVPMDEVEAIPAGQRGDALRQALRNAAHSRLPVYDGARERVVGILHALDYVRAAADDPTAGELAHEAVRVLETDPVQVALVRLQRQRELMAVVSDDAGRCRGIVTIKDLVEEITGELQAF
ncbi:MAG: CNNM domain-containing protein [Planctomycetota bacterium]